MYPDINTIDTALKHNNMSIVQESQFQDFLSQTGWKYKQHQFEGFQWVMNKEINQNMGGIVGDDMGLGKTTLMCAAILKNFKQKTLIVVPPILTQQWADIIKKHCNIKPVVVTSKTKNYTSVARFITNLPESDFTSPQVVITTYGMLIRHKNYGKPSYNVPLHKAKIRATKWGRIIFDEAHNMRNSNSSTTKGIGMLKSPIKWMVTGTPIHNSRNDFKTLCCLVGITPQEYCANTDIGIKRLTDKWLLRRRKDEVLADELPELEVNHVQIPWNNNEINMAKQVHEFMSKLPTEITRENVDRVIAMLEGEYFFGQCIRAKQFCIMPKLFSNAILKQQMVGAIPFDVNFDKPMPESSKLNKLLDIIKKQGKKQRKIVFSHFTDEIKMIQYMLNKEGFTTGILNGQTKTKERKMLLRTNTEWLPRIVVKSKSSLPTEIYKKINEYLEPDVLIVQIKAGSEGLNLQNYSEVYFTSPHWNPAVEDQAIARAHRIGQKAKKVKVWHLAMENFHDKWASIDNYCLGVQKMKREIMAEYNCN